MLVSDSRVIVFNPKSNLCRDIGKQHFIVQIATSPSSTPFFCCPPYSVTGGSCLVLFQYTLPLSLFKPALLQLLNFKSFSQRPPPNPSEAFQPLYVPRPNTALD